MRLFSVPTLRQPSFATQKLSFSLWLNPKNPYKIFCQNLAILDGNAVVITSQSLKMLYCLTAYRYHSRTENH